MPCLCNSTLSSSLDRDECQYWTSFSEAPFATGDRMQVYKGKLNGKGPRRGDFAVIKIFADRPGTDERCKQELEKSRAANEWVTRFLARGQYRPDRLQTAQLQMANMDQVSFLTRLLAPNKRRPNPGEWILLEEILNEKGNLLCFMDKYGLNPRGRSRSDPSNTFSQRTSSGSCSPGTQDMLEALMHFTYYASGGYLVMCGLEGSEDDKRRVQLKTPVFHSKDKRFGETDLGERGVREVMDHHVCNSHCHRMMCMPPSMSSPSELHQSTSGPFGDSSFHILARRVPSAPYAYSEEHLPLCDRLSDLKPPSTSYVLPAEDFGHNDTDHRDDVLVMFGLELDKSIPDDPPPPYTEYIEDVDLFQKFSPCRPPPYSEVPLSSSYSRLF